MGLNDSKSTSSEVMGRLLSLTKPYRRYWIMAVASALIGVGMSLLIPVLIGDAINYVVGPGDVDFAAILPVLAWMGAAILVSSLFQWLMTYCTNKLSFYSIRDLRLQAFGKLQKVPLKYIDSNSHGDLIQAMVDDVDRISDGLLQGFTQLFTGVVTILGTLLFMLSINVTIALVVVVLTPLSFFVASFISRRTYSKFKEQSAIRGELTGFVEEMLGNQKVVKTFCYEDRAVEKFSAMNEQLNQVGVMAQFYSSLTNPCTRFVNGVVYAAVGIIGAVSAVRGNLNVGQLNSFLIYANQYTKPFNEISGVITELQAALAAARRVFSVIDQETEPSDYGLAEQVRCDGTVDIENVAFSYVPERPLIENLNLNIRAGERVAVVGPTGCGKTTIINLLMRFYDVDRGAIRLNGVDVREMKRKTLRSMYGMVLQETWLFRGTVRDNIKYGREDATEEEMVAAAKAAYAHNFIKRLPEGYETMITEDGGNLSAGQKQLLCIARVMLTRPPMLILDEATSNIDTLTEIRVQKAFEKLMEGRTSFVVAHRLSTIQESDCILVMDAGHIIEQGTHEELLAKGGFYADLYQSQFAVSR
ncbi:ABC transporter ATP-binding protein [Cuneatibacter caecimuris]|uniref:ATP-binding cassette subfamily B protein n=1 Tax=Cuneatibacter caecimuris TaxID=1796618 RepID=A0A4Q7PQ14_9FIRM|nr:ABC transporter ATP-binding protein [Cuneatibacter caecimuris]RZT02396.1 ATP-binding cassette subfamily B protein [Cuneatibacter caecimuris]